MKLSGIGLWQAAYLVALSDSLAKFKVAWRVRFNFPIVKSIGKKTDVALRFAQNWAVTSNRDAYHETAIRSGYLLACTASAAKVCGACYCHLKLDIFNMESERGLNSRRNSSQLESRMVPEV